MSQEPLENNMYIFFYFMYIFTTKVACFILRDTERKESKKNDPLNIR